MPTETRRERIVQQLMLELHSKFDGTIGAGNVQEWNEDGNEPAPITDGGSDLPAFMVVLIDGEDDVDNDESSAGETAKIMVATVDVHFYDVPDGLTLRNYATRINGLVEQAIMRNGETETGIVVETATAIQLAHQVLVLECDYPSSIDRQRDNVGGCLFEIRYVHNEADPYTGRGD